MLRSVLRPARRLVRPVVSAALPTCSPATAAAVAVAAPSTPSAARRFATAQLPMVPSVAPKTFPALPAAAGAVGAKNLPWKQLGFSYVPTDCYLKFTWKDGKWSSTPEVSRDPNININILSNALHYGQVLFEGLKAHACKDGKVRAFATDYNNDRMNAGADRLYMPRVPRELFTYAVDSAIRLNSSYIPPYGQDGSMYVRPMLFGNGAQLGLGPAPEYTFAVVVVPVGPYYKSGLKAVDALIMDEWDRAAPMGVGAIKCAGNYAADVRPAKQAAAAGYPIALYLDAREHKYIEEFSTSNFIAISKSGAFVTPDSKSVLPSVTNKVMQMLAADAGYKVERRPIPVAELSELEEVAAVGTAVVVTPIKSITQGEKVYKFASHERLQKLYNIIRQVQLGEAEDKHNLGRVVI